MCQHGAMLSFTAVEMVGYLASVLVVVSLAMRSVVRLRVVSLIGSSVFLVYGVLIGSLPIVLTNAAIAVINVVYLRRELGSKRSLSTVLVDPTDPFLVDFVGSHRREIATQQPDFTDIPAGSFALIVNREAVPAGVLIGVPRGDTLEIVLDFVLDAYRDSRIGRWLYGPGRTVFTRAGFRRLQTAKGSPAHHGYLHSVGFVGEGPTLTLSLG